MPAATQQTTFAVDDVTVCTRRLRTEKVKASVERLLRTPVEACDGYTADVVRQPGFHTLVAAADKAYRLHLPLVLTPDVIWLTIAQGLANHVSKNAEALRSRIVPHAGKAVIEVRRDDFVRGSAENPWPEVWPVFSERIKVHIGPETHGMIVSSFSTTGPTEKAASEVVLMDCVRSYFRYNFDTFCGIPAVTLEGTAGDWEEVHRRVGLLGRYDLRWWTDAVLPITEEFVRAARGQPTTAFWRCLYKLQDESGGPYLSGWLMRLMPYLEGGEPNPLLEVPWDQTVVQDEDGLVHSHLPSSVSSVPFAWDYRGQTLDYQFLAGVTTITQDAATRAIRPGVGWAVRPTPTSESRSVRGRE